jgi:hypothetical protein
MYHHYLHSLNQAKLLGLLAWSHYKTMTFPMSQFWYLFNAVKHSVSKIEVTSLQVKKVLSKRLQPHLLSTL